MRGIIKNCCVFVCLASLLGGFAFGLAGAKHEKEAQEDMKTLAKENGYVENVDMDEFMKTSDNVSNEEYAKYTELKEEEKKAKIQAVASLITMGVGGVGGAVGALITADPDDELLFS